LRFWKKPKNVASLKGTLSEEMLDESLLLDHVKTEDYLMVALEIRSCSFLTIPAEFQNGEELGRKIDELCIEDLQAVMSATADKKGVLIRKLKKRIRESFKKVVFASAVYKAHMEWSRKLFLQTYDVEVRPSIHELYLFKNSKVKKELRRLVNVRNVARERVALSMDVSKRKTRLAFPEELSSDYLASVGKLLGYPSCCVERYVHDRLREDVNVEMRASRQVKELRKEGEEPDVYAYFVRNFFPCEPRCRSASEVGRKTFDLFSGVNPKLGDLYLGCIRRNVEMVEKYPELIGQYREKLKKRAQKLSRM
jgi:hypothetical protein